VKPSTHCCAATAAAVWPAGVFTKADEALLQAFASELGVLIDRKRLQLTLDKVRSMRGQGDGCDGLRTDTL
jgi:GAF domain-containing protein